MWWQEWRPFRTDQQKTALRHGISAIHCQIDQHLFELVRIHFDACVSAVQFGAQLNIFPNQPAQHAFQILD